MGAQVVVPKAGVGTDGMRDSEPKFRRLAELVWFDLRKVGGSRMVQPSSPIENHQAAGKGLPLVRYQ